MSELESVIAAFKFRIAEVNGLRLTVEEASSPEGPYYDPLAPSEYKVRIGDGWAFAEVLAVPADQTQQAWENQADALANALVKAYAMERYRKAAPTQSGASEDDAND